MILAALYNLRQWDALTKAECESIATAVAKTLPKPFKFDGVERCAMGGITRFVAFFLHTKRRLSLIIGGDAELGYDRTAPYPFTKAQLKDWQHEMVDEMGWKGTIHDYLNEVLSPHRRVRVSPFLMEVKPEKQKHGGEVSKETSDEFAETLAKSGFRLPTSDEWEYACAAGTRSLWRWGNTCPTDEDSYRVKKFNLHIKPNAFGLRYTGNTYHAELCQAGLLRQGDGGGMVCGGSGAVATWLPLASAFLDTSMGKAGYFDPLYIRRVFELPT